MIHAEVHILELFKNLLLDNLQERSKYRSCRTSRKYSCQKKKLTSSKALWTCSS